MNEGLKMKVAIVQIRSIEDVYQNLLLVDSFVQSATQLGCDLICFPENILYRGRKTIALQNDYAVVHLRDSVIEPVNSIGDLLKSFLQDWKIHVSLGSVLEKNPHERRPFNTHLWCEPDGEILTYQKIHLFRFSGKQTYDEASEISAGQNPLVVDCKGFHIGLSVCYDLRFPEMFRWMSLTQRQDVILVPAAFAQETGKVHWHCLLRARAIENLSYILAPAQWGGHQDDRGQKMTCYGHSIAYDPWGQPMTELGSTGDSMFLVEITKKRIQQCRERLPSTDQGFFKLSPPSGPL